MGVNVFFVILAIILLVIGYLVRYKKMFKVIVMLDPEAVAKIQDQEMLAKLLGNTWLYSGLAFLIFPLAIRFFGGISLYVIGGFVFVTFAKYNSTIRKINIGAYK